MALKLKLKPHEKLIIDGAVIRNGSSRCELFIENNVPLLREKDIIGINEADSPCKKVYFVIQMMYVDEKNIAEHHKTYWALVREIIEAAPSTKLMFQVISNHILRDNFYLALKAAQKLIEYEQEVMNRVRTASGL
jgi:flagellar biosynthesis repressor protein FlbT